jgi:hypothetical protein
MQQLLKRRVQKSQSLQHHQLISMHILSRLFGEI